MALNAATRAILVVLTAAAMPLFSAPATAVELCDRTLELKTPRMSGEDVKRAQELLRRRGETVKKIDGVYGTGTAKAVRSFQKKWDLKVDGKIGPKTCRKLKG